MGQIIEKEAFEGISVKLTATQRQRKIARLWFRGLTKDEIAEQTGYPQRQVSEDLKVIRFQLTPKTIRTIEYYRNKSRNRLDIIRSKAWEMVEDANFRHGAKVAALRLLKEVEDLQTKVDGVVTEKVPIGPEKKAEELSRKLIEIARGKDKGNGHEEKEDELVSDAITHERAEETNP